MSPQRILIVGCSIAGPTLASFLLLSDLPATEKPHITVLEQSKQLRTEGQNIDIRGAGVTIIKKLGIEKIIRASTTGEEGVQLVDSQNRTWAQFSADKTGKVSTPTADIEILRGTLAKILTDRSEYVSKQVRAQGGAGIEYIFGDTLDKIQQDGDHVTVQFKNSGESRIYDLVVGADGLQSKTRAMVFGKDSDESRMYRLGMYGGFFSMPRGETDTEWRRWFHTYGRRGIMTRPSQFKDRTTVLMTVINEEDPRLEEVAARGRSSVEGQKALLAEYFKRAGWECERIIKELVESKDFYYSPIAQIKMDKWSKGRVVLLGDAGYCASPLSGMGTTLAMSGAYNLAGAILQHPNDHNRAFEQFETNMRPNVIRAQKLAPGMPRLINPETWWGVWILHLFAAFIYYTHIQQYLAKNYGPPANAVPVEEYGFRSLPEMEI